MSCSTIAIIVGIIVALLVVACAFDHISVAERREKHFRRWKRWNDPTPPDDHE